MYLTNCFSFNLSNFKLEILAKVMMMEGGSVTGGEAAPKEVG